MISMYDLIDESGKDLEKYGYHVTELGKYGSTMAALQVETQEKSEKLGFALGQYYILSSPLIHVLDEECWHYLARHLAEKFEKILQEHQIKPEARTLIVGLGNATILADALGKMTLQNIPIDATQPQNHVYKICPNIYTLTGINTFDFVRMIATGLQAELVILVDSLATNEISRLGTAIQLTDTGMTPGSGVNGLGKKISEETLHCPCISFGVPLMMFAKSLTPRAPEDLILAPKDIHENVETLGFIIATAICIGLHIT